MLFVARFQDQSGQQHLRRIHQDAHDAYVASKKDKILVSGPLSRDDLGNATGGLWYVNGKDRRDVEALYQSAPFWIVGLWASAILLPQHLPVNAYADVRVTCL